MDWFVEALKKYAVMAGRAQRSEYWYFVLFYTLIFIPLAIADVSIGTYNADVKMGVLSGLFSVGMLLPLWGVSVRRLHDIDRSAWWLLVGFIPVVGPIVLLVFNLRDSQPFANRYGPNPKDALPGERFSLT